MTIRKCWLCHQVGITVECANGNIFRHHMRDRHSVVTKEQHKQTREHVRVYRRKVIILTAKLGLGKVK